MKRMPRVSIIIPVMAVNDYIKESVPKMLELDWPDLEIIIFPDTEDKKHSWPKTRIIASGKMGPAGKRDLALKYATGEILAFLDDDAYPEKDWLKRSMHCFREDNKVGAVGGPAITPLDDGVLQKVSGAVFESYLGGGMARNRYLCVGDHCDTDDWPTVNFLIRKDVFEKIGGFDSAFWPGEDTKLCLDIAKVGYKIKYDPEAVVYHHRRSNLIKHLRQIGTYALHRGYFAKRYPDNSLKPGYFIPTLFDIYLLLMLLVPLAMRKNPLAIYYLVPLAIYVLGLIIDGLVISWRWRNALVGLVTVPMIFLTHIWYGIRFIQGLLIPNLKSKLKGESNN